MTVSTTLSNLHTVTDVQVQEFRVKRVLVDRSVRVTLDCGHAHNVSLPLRADPPCVGDCSNWRCPEPECVEKRRQR